MSNVVQFESRDQRQLARELLEYVKENTTPEESDELLALWARNEKSPGEVPGPT